jgi:hypothetical protein
MQKAENITSHRDPRMTPVVALPFDRRMAPFDAQSRPSKPSTIAATGVINGGGQRHETGDASHERGGRHRTRLLGGSGR